MTAIENDADFLARIARRWTEALDQDGAEPSEELLRQLQGAFLRKPRHGLQHLEIFATADQFEHLMTVMNTATNPRTGPDTGEGTATGHTAQAGPGDGSEAADEPGPSDEPATAEEDAALPSLDLRSRPQRLLDGLVGACKAALATGGLPAAGGLRPQVMATIDYRDLLTRLGTTRRTGAPANPHSTARDRHGTGTLAFTGPVTASTVRKIACDADIIPVVLGGEGQVLDIGRASRVFPPHIRKAITARDRGCAFPQCTIPAPWCEAHHITYWSRGGTTGTEQRNPALLPSPPRDPQGTLEHPDAHRHPLVHPATPPRPSPDAPPEQLLPPGVTPSPGLKLASTDSVGPPKSAPSVAGLPAPGRKSQACAPGRA